jgi:hypothetical protein
MSNEARGDPFAPPVPEMQVWPHTFTNIHQPVICHSVVSIGLLQFPSRFFLEVMAYID